MVELNVARESGITVDISGVEGAGAHGFNAKS